MRIAITALMLLALAGCSSDRDEEAYLELVYELASQQERENFSDEALLQAGDLACSMSEDGQDIPEESIGQTTGIPWSLVWWPAHDELCPQ